VVGHLKKPSKEVFYYLCSGEELSWHVVGVMAVSVHSKARWGQFDVG